MQISGLKGQIPDMLSLVSREITRITFKRPACNAIPEYLRMRVMLRNTTSNYLNKQHIKDEKAMSSMPSNMVAYHRLSHTVICSNILGSLVSIIFVFAIST